MNLSRSSQTLSAFKAPSLIFVLVWRVILNFISENIGFYCSKGLRVTRYINAHFLVTIFVTNFVNVFVVSHKENLTSCAHNLVDVLKQLCMMTEMHLFKDFPSSAMTALLRCTIFNVMNNVITFSRYFSFASYNQHFYIYFHIGIETIY